eukprot:SAG22_NODE_144_length_17700_cov_21.959207_4_plen_123_part_00
MATGIAAASWAAGPAAGAWPAHSGWPRGAARRALASMGIQLCIIFLKYSAASPDDNGDIVGGIEVVRPEGGLRILGHPLGSDEFCRAFYARQAAKTGAVVDALEELAAYGHEGSVQAAYNPT